MASKPYWVRWCSRYAFVSLETAGHLKRCQSKHHGEQVNLMSSRPGIVFERNPWLQPLSQTSCWPGFDLQCDIDCKASISSMHASIILDIVPAVSSTIASEFRASYIEIYRHYQDSAVRNLLILVKTTTAWIYGRSEAQDARGLFPPVLLLSPP
jgi:hypothetical protein